MQDEQQRIEVRRRHRGMTVDQAAVLFVFVLTTMLAGIIVMLSLAVEFSDWFVLPSFLGAWADRRGTSRRSSQEQSSFLGA